MKYILVFFLVVIGFNVNSQEIKPLLIGGSGLMSSDKYNKGHYHFAYFEHKFIKNQAGSNAFGFYAKYNYWQGIYDGKTQERINSFGVGLSLGMIPSYLFSYDVYNNISFGYRQAYNQKWTKYEGLPQEEKKFVDITMYSHIQDEYKTFFFRHKLFVDISCNVDSSLTKEYFRIKFDESIYNFYLTDKLNLAPKIIAGYTNNAWHNFYELGLGLDLFGEWFVNIVDLSYIYRYDPEIDKNSFHEISLAINFLN